MITHSLWISQSKDIRNKMKEIFSIPRSTFIWVDGGVVKSDGVTQEDLKALTDEKLQDFSGISGSSYDMFIECVRKLENLKPLEAIEEVILEESNITTNFDYKLQEPDIKENKEGLKCELCGKIVKNELAIKIHKGRYHKQTLKQ